MLIVSIVAHQLHQPVTIPLQMACCLTPYNLGGNGSGRQESNKLAYFRRDATGGGSRSIRSSSITIGSNTNIITNSSKATAQPQIQRSLVFSDPDGNGS